MANELYMNIDGEYATYATTVNKCDDYLTVTVNLNPLDTDETDLVIHTKCLNENQAWLVAMNWLQINGYETTFECPSNC